MDEATRNRIEKLERDLFDLNQEVYRNNFKAHQDFNKTSFFNTRLKVPVYSSLPSTCEEGELVCVGGGLYIASATNTWSLVGTQI